MLRVGELLSKSFIDFPWLLYYERLYIFVFGKFKTKIEDLSSFKKLFQISRLHYFDHNGDTKFDFFVSLFHKISLQGVKVVPLFLFFSRNNFRNECLQIVLFLPKT